MSSKGRKVQRAGTKQEAAAFLRELADLLEGGEGSGSDWSEALRDDWSRLEAKLKLEGEIATLKLKVKGDDPAREGRESYKKLKKRMDRTWDIIRDAVEEGAVPPDEAVDMFVEDSNSMTTYPGKGDEFYAEYDAATAAFRSAHEAGDMAAMSERMVELDRIKKRCHKEHA